MKQNVNFSFKKHENIGFKYCNYFKAFTEYSNDMLDVSKNIEKNNQGEKHKVLIVFHDMIADMISNKKLNAIITEILEAEN